MSTFLQRVAGVAQLNNQRYNDNIVSQVNAAKAFQDRVSGVVQLNNQRYNDNIVSKISDAKALQESLGSVIGSPGTPTSPKRTSPSGPSGVSGDSGGYYPVAPAPSAQSLDYLNAELAKHYGMNASTAYQEALSNTAYQRAVKDMQAAGLNPASLFAAGRAYTAGGVGYVSPLADESGSGSGGSARSYSRGRSSGKTFSSSTYSAIVNGAGFAGYLITGNYGGYLGASTAAKAVLAGIDALKRG